MRVLYRKSLWLGMFGFATCLLLIQLASAQPPTVQDLSKGVDERWAAYSDVKFIYEVRHRNRQSQTAKYPIRPEIDTHGQFVASRNTLKLKGHAEWQAMSSLQATWVQQRRNSFGRDYLQAFYANDDKVAYSFHRFNPHMRGAGNMHQASIAPLSHGSSPREDLFPNFLFLRLNGITAWDLFPARRCDEEVWNHRLADFQVASQFRVDGQEVYRLKYSSDPKDEFRIEVDMNGAPDFIIHRLEFFHQNESAELYQISDVSRVAGIAFPSQGHFHRRAIGQIHELDYEFKVTYAGQLTTEDADDWIPAWPPNTFVQDTSTGVNRHFGTNRENPFASFSQAEQPVLWVALGSVFAFSVLIALWFTWMATRFETRLMTFLIGFAGPTVLLSIYLDPVLATFFAWTSICTLLLAIPIRGLWGTSIVLFQSTVSDADGETLRRECYSRIGFREWAMFLIGLCVAIVLAVNADLTLIEKGVGLTFAVLSACLLSLLFHGILCTSGIRAIVSLLVLGSLLALFLQIPFAAGFGLPYWGRDHAAWCQFHLAAFATMFAMAGVLRINRWRIVSDKSFGHVLSLRSIRFGLRELGLWVTAVAILIAVTQMLGRST